MVKVISSLSRVALGSAVAMAAACGGHAMTQDMPDAAPDAEIIEGTRITIGTYPYGLEGEAPFNTTLVAFRDGDGPWRAISGHNGIYIAGAKAEHYSVATICALNETPFILNEVNVYYEAVAATTQLHAKGCVHNGPPMPSAYVNIPVDVHGLQSGESASVAVGGQWEQGATDSTHLDFTAPRGLDIEVVAAAMVRTEQGGGEVEVPRAIIRGPVVDALHDQTLTYDLTTGVVPETPGFTLLGRINNENISIDSYYATAKSRGTWLLALDGRAVLDPPYHYVALPASVRQPEDISDIMVFAFRYLPDGSIPTRSVEQAVAAGAEATVELPPPWTAAPPVLGDTPGSATVTLPATATALRFVDYTVSLAARVTTATGHDQHYWTLHVDSGWTSAQPSAQVSTPDLSGVAGWSAGMAFPPHAEVTWSITRTEHDLPLQGTPTVGRRILRAMVGGKLGP